MKRGLLVLLAIGLISSSGLFADSSEVRSVLPQLTDAEYQQLDSGEMITAKGYEGSKIEQYFVPQTTAYDRALAKQDIQDGFSVAALSYIPYGPKLKAMSSTERQLTIFNAIRAISTQEGLTYISWRAGNIPKVLIERSSYMADEKNMNNLLPDPVATTFPYETQSYVYQRDTSFGGNRYLHTYTNTDKEILVDIENLANMRVLGVFTAVKKGQLNITMATYQLDDGLLLEALSSIEGRDPVVSIFGLKVDLPSAFKRRLVALQNWFRDQLAAIETN